jgi:hypothetical protein
MTARPRRWPGPPRRSGLTGRESLAQTERLQDLVELGLREPAGDVGDAELAQEVLELGGGQVHPKAAEQALQSGEAVDAAAAGEAAEELAEQALAVHGVDRDDDGVSVGFAIEVHDEAEQVQVQWPEDQLEDLAGLRLRLSGACG